MRAEIIAAGCPRFGGHLAALIEQNTFTFFGYSEIQLL